MAALFLRPFASDCLHSFLLSFIDLSERTLSFSHFNSRFHTCPFGPSSGDGNTKRKKDSFRGCEGEGCNGKREKVLSHRKREHEQDLKRVAGEPGPWPINELTSVMCDRTCVMSYSLVLS
jgi:hypothetical protein